VRSNCALITLSPFPRYSVVARNNAILKALVLQAKREYEAEAVHKIQIYTADRGYWRWADSRHKRPMRSIVLNPGVKEMLLNDAKDFLVSETVSAAALLFPLIYRDLDSLHYTCSGMLIVVFRSGGVIFCMVFLGRARPR
jgi:hypothetical protein